MTQERILRLAYDAALMLWGNERERLELDPDNEISQHRERKRWEELKQVEALLQAAEQQKSPC